MTKEIKIICKHFYLKQNWGEVFRWNVISLVKEKFILSFVKSKQIFVLEFIIFEHLKASEEFMAIETVQVVAILPDGREYFADLRKYGNNSRFDYEQAARDAVRKYELTTPRKNPQTVDVKVCGLSIKEGKLERSTGCTFKITPPLERMTEEEYTTEMKAILDTIPESFRSFVSIYSYEHGHSAGYEEIILIANNLVNALKPCIEEFHKSIIPEHGRMKMR